MSDLTTPTVTDVPGGDEVVPPPHPAASTLRVFKLLQRGEMVTIKHGMHTFPLVDVYELDFFDAVATADEDNFATRVQFYVYHTTDRRAGVPGAGGKMEYVTVEKPGEHWCIPFEEALRMAGVEYGDERTLGDVVTNFWSALFSLPNDSFDEASWGISPWLERAVGDRRTVGELRPNQGGEWDDLWFRFFARKTLNWSPAAGGGTSLTNDFKQEIEGFIRNYHVKASNILTSIIPTSTPPAALPSSTYLAAARSAFELVNEHGAAALTLVGEFGADQGPAGAGLSVGVEVVQFDVTQVGLRLLGGDRKEVGVMVLLRP